MKLVILFLCISWLVIGCSNPYDSYQNAYTKTSEIPSGKASAIVTIQSQYKDEIYENQYTIYQEFNREDETSKSTILAELPSYGIEATLYQQESKIIIASPLLPRLIVIDDASSTGEEFASAPNLTIDTATIEQIENLWHQLITDENITELGNVIVKTPDGAVKGKEYKVTMTNDHVKPVLEETIELFLVNHPGLFTEEHIDAYEMVKDVEFETISFYAYIDRDFHIIEERFSISANIGEDVKLSINFQLQRWDLGKKIGIELPIITDNNVMNIDELINDFLQMEEYKQ